MEFECVFWCFLVYFDFERETERASTSSLCCPWPGKSNEQDTKQLPAICILNLNKTLCIGFGNTNSSSGKWITVIVRKGLLDILTFSSFLDFTAAALVICFFLVILRIKCSDTNYSNYPLLWVLNLAYHHCVTGNFCPYNYTTMFTCITNG